MSHYSIDSVDDAPLLDPVTFNWDLRLYRSFVLAGLVLLVYDHTLTLATEVKFIWAAKLRPSIYWFLALRYIGLVANIANCVLYFAELNHESCVKMQLMWKALIVSQELLVEYHNRVLIRVELEGTLIMRVFAMYDRNRWILICLLAVFAPWPALALWDVIKEGPPQIFSGPGISGFKVYAGLSSKKAQQAGSNPGPFQFNQLMREMEIPIQDDVHQLSKDRQFIELLSRIE
ncbi:hypothetical protein DFH09DRAFT_1103711 [Mycena vulgaris]|nr:hypothetical protein DFH09DRAFT_1103711 [Mycena vulgaris]